MQRTKFLELLPTKHSHLFKVKLNLESKSRLIGVLDNSGQGKFLTNRKEKQLYKKTNSLGLNKCLLTSPDIDFKWIIIDFDGKQLITTRLFFVTHSDVITLPSDEIQYLLPLQDFGLKKAEEYERSISKQFGLLREVHNESV